MEILVKGEILSKENCCFGKCNHCKEEWCMCILDDGC